MFLQLWAEAFLKDLWVKREVLLIFCIVIVLKAGSVFYSLLIPKSILRFAQVGAQ